MMTPDEIRSWCDEFRKGSGGSFQINLWIPDASPTRDFELEKRQREFLGTWGPPVPREAGDAGLPDFDAQCQAILALAPKVISSIMSLYPSAFVSDPRLADALMEHSRRSKHLGPSDWVFANRLGQPRWQESILPRQIKPAAVRAGVGKIG